MARGIYIRTPETRRILSEAHKGYVMPASQKEKIRLKSIGNKSRIGQCNSEEMRKKISMANKGRKHLPHSLETRKKMSLAKEGHIPWNKGLKGIMAGENSPHWKGGISNREIHSLNNPRYREWRMNVFARDNFKCRIADSKCSGMLQAHHILRWAEYPELRYEINNGIALCQFHHPRKKIDERNLEPLFKTLVA